MIFPENENFELFFSTFTNKINSDDASYVKHQIFEEYSAVDNVGTNKVFREKCLYVKQNSIITLESVQKKVSKHLMTIGHKTNESIVNSILYIITFLDLRTEAVQLVNKALQNVTTTDLNQFLIYPISNSGYSVQLDDFYIGTIDHLKIQKYCAKFGTNYYKLYSGNLKDRFGVSRRYQSIKILNTIWLADSAIKYDHIFIEALFCYFDELSKVYEEYFYIKFDESQEISTFLSNSYLDLKQMNLLLHPAQYLSIFLNIAKKTKFGWIVPKQRMTLMNLGSGPTNKEINKLKDKYGFSKFGDSELDIAFKKFVSFCSKGERYLIDNRISESYLHYVIALDLLFGDKDSSTQSIAKRTAFIVAFSSSQSFQNSVKSIKDIYNRRSKYVHEGIKVDKYKIEELREILLTIFRSYLNLFKKKKVQDIKFENWIKKLDLGVAMVEAKEKPSDQFLIDCGIEANHNTV